MAAAHHQKHDPAKKVKLVMPARGLVNCKLLKKILDDLVKQLAFEIAIDGAEFSAATDKGLLFKIRPGGDEDHAWKVGRVGGTFGIKGGAYNSIEIPFTPLAEDFTGWVYIAATWDLTLVEDYVYPATLSGAVLATGASVPANAPEGATFYVPLVQLINGKVASQAATRSISANVCDRAADGGAVHTILQS